MLNSFFSCLFFQLKLVGLWWHRKLKKRILSILRYSSSDLKILGQTLLGEKMFTVTQGRKRLDHENTRTSAPREHRRAARSHQARSSQQVGEQRGPAAGHLGNRDARPLRRPLPSPAQQPAPPARPGSQEPTRRPHTDHGRRRPCFTSTTGASRSFSRSPAASGPGARPPRLPPPPVSQTPAPRVCSRRCEST